jgi:hypothetical protein
MPDIFPADYWKPRHQVDENGKPKMDPPPTLYEQRAYAEGYAQCMEDDDALSSDDALRF